MYLHEIREILDAAVICGGDHLDREVHSACGSDFMSDVLAYVKDQAVLLTGLVNPQVIRTADMMDMTCIVFVRGKAPDEGMIALAEERDIVLMCSKERMYNACGKLYLAGLGR
jgi:predicted transcriptional regulator